MLLIFVAYNYTMLIMDLERFSLTLCKVPGYSVWPDNGVEYLYLFSYVKLPVFSIRKYYGSVCIFFPLGALKRPTAKYG